MPATRFVLTAFLAASGLVGQTVETGSGREQWDSPRILTALSSLQISQEVECEAEGIESSAWAGLQDEIAELHHGPLSPYDGVVFPNFHYVQIEHIVARKEADESGLCTRNEDSRKAFAADLLNLTLAPGSLNASKGDSDAHDLETAEDSLFRDNLTDHGLCWWAAQTVRVKDKYGLSVDTDEESALRGILENCTDEQVFRPTLSPGSEWVFRTEFLQELHSSEMPDSSDGERSIPSCSDPVAVASDLALAVNAADTYLSSIACIQPANPEAARTAAVQNACVETLESMNLSINCSNIGDHCPEVDRILTGEPLYASGRDRDNDGVACENL